MDYLLGSGLVGSLGVIAWLAYVAIDATRQRAPDLKARLLAERDRDAARADVARLTVERDAELHQIDQLGTALAAERRKVTDARINAVANAAPGDVGAAVDRLLVERLADQARGAPAGGGAAKPAWIGL